MNPRELRDAVVRHGSFVSALSLLGVDVPYSMIEDVRKHLMLSAPVEIRGNEHAVILWHKYSDVYERCIEDGDYKGARLALDSQQSIIMKAY